MFCGIKKLVHRRPNYEDLNSLRWHDAEIRIVPKNINICINIKYYSQSKVIV